MALINQPPNFSVDENGVRVNPGWANFFATVFNLLAALTLSGTTANRPTAFLWVGRPYFDTSLGANGKPIWVADITAGVATWVDATSTVV